MFAHPRSTGCRTTVYPSPASCRASQSPASASRPVVESILMSARANAIASTALFILLSHSAEGLPYPFLEHGPGVGLFIAILHDNGGGDREPPLLALAGRDRPRARDDDRPLRNDQRPAVRFDDAAVRHVVEGCRPREDGSRREHRAPFDDRPLVDSAVAAHED